MTLGPLMVLGAHVDVAPFEGALTTQEILESYFDEVNLYQHHLHGTLAESIKPPGVMLSVNGDEVEAQLAFLYESEQQVVIGLVVWEHTYLLLRYSDVSLVWSLDQSTYVFTRDVLYPLLIAGPALPPPYPGYDPFADPHANI